MPPIAISKQTAVTSTSLSLQSCRTCSLLDLLTQLEICPSQQARILKLQAQFLSATVFTHPMPLPLLSHIAGVMLVVMRVFSGAALGLGVFFFLFPDFPGFRNGLLRKRQGVLEDRFVGG